MKTKDEMNGSQNDVLADLNVLTRVVCTTLKSLNFSFTAWLFVIQF